MRVITPVPSPIAPDDLKVLLEIHGDFGPDYNLLAKIMRNEDV